MRNFVLFFLVVCAAAVSSPRTASAHDSQPLAVQIDEQSHRTYRARMKLPLSMQGHLQPQLIIPEGCDDVTDSRTGADAAGQAKLFKCSQALDGRTLKIAFADFNPSLAIFFRYQPLKGPMQTSLQPPDDAEWRVPPRSQSRPAHWADSGRKYLRFGAEHILAGFDHLLFVVCLLILAGRTRRILLAITGFTIAHSLTLGLAALEVVRPPPAVIEALIALSIVVLAAEIVRNDKFSLAWRYPMAMSMTFGLLHGFGFASVLGEIGLPEDQELLALFSFNVGVEIGQIAFVALLLALSAGARKFVMRSDQPSLAWAPSAVAGYMIGTVASFWLLQRVMLFSAMN